MPFLIVKIVRRQRIINDLRTWVLLKMYFLPLKVGKIFKFQQPAKHPIDCPSEERFIALMASHGLDDEALSNFDSLIRHITLMRGNKVASAKLAPPTQF
jgi:hypothetical protein